MNKTLILIFAFITTVPIFGQTATKAELTGKWKVDKIIKKPSNPRMKPLVDGFEKSTFHFKANEDFELTTTNNSELFKMLMTEVLNGTKWKFETKNQLVKIGNQEDDYTAMGIFVKKDNELMLFNLDESGLIFKMKKVE